MAKQLHNGDETRRRWKIIAASRSADSQMLPQLLALLDSDETLENRRHVVRSLGNIGGPEAEAKLLQLLGSEQSLMLGDIAHSLGKLKCQRATPQLKQLAEHPEAWVRQNVTFALRQIRGDDL